MKAPKAVDVRIIAASNRDLSKDLTEVREDGLGEKRQQKRILIYLLEKR